MKEERLSSDSEFSEDRNFQPKKSYESADLFPDEKPQHLDSLSEIKIKKIKTEVIKKSVVKKEKLSPATIRVKSEALAGTSKRPPPRRKTLKKTEVDFEPINRWWEKAGRTEQTTEQWTYLEHNGIMFSPDYIPHGVPVTFDGQPVVLPAEAEEVANFWCGVIGTDFEENEKFQKNFWKAFMEKLPQGHSIREKPLFRLCDFTPIKDYLDSEKERKKALTKEEKEDIKRQKQELDAPYAYALVDWLREKLGNSKVEPPGLFRGRGDHPKQGMLKARIFPENVILNCAESAPVPPVEGSMAGHCWGDVYHDNTVTWLAFFKDTINDQFKYMYLAAQSKFKGMQDFLKYEKARKLKDYVGTIRANYTEKMKSNDSMDRQLGTATYLIDFLALRVGGEKDTDEEADTVGCCSLRVEHITFKEEKDEIQLDFLGKDSIRYFNTVK
ncbi:hypothetical protein IE077_000754, partial [Cardiosporidium cionae]